MTVKNNGSLNTKMCCEWSYVNINLITNNASFKMENLRQHHTTPPPPPQKWGVLFNHQDMLHSSQQFWFSVCFLGQFPPSQDNFNLHTQDFTSVIILWGPYTSQNKTVTCATYSINWSVFITKMKSFYCTVKTGSLNETVYTLSLKI
jgi:hypothetical protein